MPVPTEWALTPGSAPYEVALEDELFLVVDKPAGVVVHPGAGHDSDTLVNGLVVAYPEIGAMGASCNWGLVHRLDRDTSGLLIVARTPDSHVTLQRQIRHRETERRYLALAAGREFDHATGTIDAPLGRDPRYPTRRMVLEAGRPARTHYTRLATWPETTLLEVTLETGRTHQIRVHLAAIGASLMGDTTYGHRGWPGSGPGRMWLHAISLDFTHPRTGRPVSVRSGLPYELVDVLEALGPPRSGEVLLG